MNTLFSGALFIGILTACWNKIKMFLSRLWSVFFVNIRVGGHLSTAVKSHCWKNFRRSPFGSRRYGSEQAWVRPHRRLMWVGYETMGNDPILFWKGWRPILVGTSGNGNSDGNQASPQASFAGNTGDVEITFIRGTFKIDQFLVKCLDEYNDKFGADNKRETSRFFIRRLVGMGARRRMGDQNEPKSGYAVASKELTFAVETGELRILKWKQGEVGPDLSYNKKAMDAMAFPPIVMEIVQELDHWLKSADWYREKQIPWTRGWLLIGKPGTGKSSLVRAIAQDFNLPIFIFDLASMSNEEFLRYWDEMRGNTPCIALFEDMDGVFNGRKNITGEQGGGLTFDCFLNALSGVDNADGVVKVMTSNNPEALDEALGLPRENDKGEMISTRPGRADRAIVLPILDDDCRLRLANRILSDCPEFITGIVTEGTGDTGAQFQDRCAKIALREHWARLKTKEFSDLFGLKAEETAHAA